MQIYLLLTENCNLKCKFCIRGNKKEEYINFSCLRKIIDQNISYFKDSMVFVTGGEPTLHPEFVDICNYLVDKCKNVCINTNGTTSYWVDCIDKRILTQISMDGDEPTNNCLRGKGVFSKIEDLIKKLELNNLQYCVSSTFGLDNYENVDDIIEILKKYNKMKFWKVSPLLPFGCGGFDNILSTNSWNNLVNYIIKRCSFRVFIKKLYDFSLLEKKKHLLDNDKSRINCGDLKCKIYIYPDLTLYPCTCLTMYPIGNIKNKTINELLSEEKAKIFIDYKISEDSICYDCIYKNYCNGGCIGMSVLKYGKLGMGDFRCPFHQKHTT